VSRAPKSHEPAAPATLLGPFESLEAAARYAETHDIGVAGPPADLPEARGGTLTLQLPPDVLRHLRREAVRRRTHDLQAVAADLLAAALRAAASEAEGRTGA
jgi:hypothetical protein